LRCHRRYPLYSWKWQETSFPREGPFYSDDLKTILLEELDSAQQKLLGDELDTVVNFWTDTGIPRDENWCRDRLAEMIRSPLEHYGITLTTEADMPDQKRVDLACAKDQMHLPVEVKGQWNKTVWDAATGQLDELYLRDWRSGQRDIYCVFWFGKQTAKSGRQIRPHPDGHADPQTADAMRAMLIERIPEPRRAFIEVRVIDLTKKPLKDRR
jgi:hypothetical protein